MDAIAFTEKYFQKFLFDGFGGQTDRRCVVRDQLILLLMHGTGVRESEPMHLYVQDIHRDRDTSDSVVISLYHTEDGKTPDNWKDKNGSSNRSAYLRAKFGLVARNRIHTTRHAGWKSVVVDDKTNYMQLFWFPETLGSLFSQLWNEYLYHLSMIERDHPYAFISFHPKYIGQPNTLNAFKDNYNRALKRIGLSPGKTEGLSPHGHRHAYGRRVQQTGVEPLVIQKALHHKSLESQAIYTAPSMGDVTRALFITHIK